MNTKSVGSKTIAVILAGGSGSRMGGPVKKQFMELAGKPLLAHTLEAFESYEAVDEIVLVTSSTGSCEKDQAEIEYVKREIVEAYGFTKVSAIVPGGAERYHSVYAGLKACQSDANQNGLSSNKAVADGIGGRIENETTGAVPCYVLIHDGARAFVTKEVLDNVMQGLTKSDACVAAVPVKDTIKKADADGFVTQTLERKELYAMQTPQAFNYALVMSAYEELIENELSGGEEKRCFNQAHVTDDAMVVERYHPEQQILLVGGAYDNIKVTTPDDVTYGEFLINAKER